MSKVPQKPKHIQLCNTKGGKTHFRISFWVAFILRASHSFICGYVEWGMFNSSRVTAGLEPGVA